MKEQPKVYKTKEEAFEAKHKVAREAFKKIDMAQAEALIAQRRRSK